MGISLPSKNLEIKEDSSRNPWLKEKISFEIIKYFDLFENENQHTSIKKFVMQLMWVQREMYSNKMLILKRQKGGESINAATSK